MKKILLIILTITLLGCKKTIIKQEQVIFDRIEYIYNLKSTIDKNIWKGFANEKYDLPLVYYSDTNCYVTNPTEKFLNIYNTKLVFETKNLKIFKTDSLIDNVSFHMETSITLGDYTPEYNYKSPFMNSSSFEITKKTIPDISSTESWITMIVHEYFHGFQFKHQIYLNDFEDNIVSTPSDSLRILYKENKWFKESIDKENNLLLNAIKSKSTAETSNLIQTFFTLRDKRRERINEKISFDLKEVEQVYETREGSARYVEYKLYKEFSSMQSPDKLVKSDSSFHSFKYFKNYEIEKDKWLYLTSKTSYYYAIGFNMARLLDKLKIEYKSRLFNERGLTLEKILKGPIKEL
jgi:hypothetical protein